MSEREREIEGGIAKVSLVSPLIIELVDISEENDIKHKANKDGTLREQKDEEGQRMGKVFHTIDFLLKYYKHFLIRPLTF